jgi:hypothetical protein
VAAQRDWRLREEPLEQRIFEVEEAIPAEHHQVVASASSRSRRPGRFTAVLAAELLDRERVLVAKQL